MVALSIVGVLISLAYPYYQNEILKSRFVEAKTMIQKIAFAQERFKIEHGEYYSINTLVKNETKIFQDLGVNLSESNNFLYSIKTNTLGTNYIVKAYMRFNDITCDVDGSFCKQIGTKIRDKWVSKYNTDSSKHILLFSYPDIFSYTNNNFNDINISLGN